MDLKETDILGADIAGHWYYRSKAKAMMCLLDGFKPGIVLDVGAGSGFFSKHLLAHSSAEEAWCVDTSYDNDSDTIEMEKQLHFRRSIESVEANLVLLMDVLEHVDDDVGLLQEYVKKVPRGSRFLITVPAFQFLWSGHDIFLDHKRRYTLHQLEDVVVSAGLKLIHGSYYFGMVFPLATVLRLANRWERNTEGASRSQLTRHHPFVNYILAGVCQSELPFMRVNRFAGLTVFCLAESI
jgi:SAM-dependent methyltransferase